MVSGLLIARSRNGPAPWPWHFLYGRRSRSATSPSACHVRCPGLCLDSRRGQRQSPTTPGRSATWFG